MIPSTTKNIDSEINKVTISRQNKDISVTTQIVDLLPMHMCDTYDLWIKVGKCLYSSYRKGGKNEAYKVWKKWSQKSLKFKIGECKDKWATFKTDLTQTLKFIHYYAKQANINKYNVITGNEPDEISEGENNNNPPDEEPTQSTSDVCHDINEIEDMLDKEIHCYSKYTENNPMLGITREENTWRLRLMGKKCSTTNVDKDTLITKMLEKIKIEYSKKQNIQCSPIGSIMYKNKDIIIYGTFNTPLFDIHHIINLLDVDEKRKYRECKDNVTHYGFKKNAYGGYIIKEFIQENIVYAILSSSDSEFSKGFKLDMVTLQNKIKECIEKIKEKTEQNKPCDEIHSKSECVNDITPNSIQSTSVVVHHDINEIEDVLDKEIHCYSKYTENNPMLGISRDGTTWRLRNEEYKCNVKNKDKNKLIELMKNKIISANNKQLVDVYKIDNIMYKNKDIIIYGTFNTPLFDIHHIIHLLDIDDEQKYYNCKDNVTHYGFKKNEYGGYIIKEFIQENMMYTILSSSDSEFSKGFKLDMMTLQKKIKECMEKNKLEHTEIINEEIDDTLEQNELIQSTSVVVHHDINEIENMLDNEIHGYNKYTENNPMLGITWDGSYWRLKSREYEFNKQSKYKNKLIELIKNKIISVNKKQLVDVSRIDNILYKNKDIMIYGTYKVPLFDIHHIIRLLDIDDERKYRECKDKVTHYGFKKNEYEGYIIKEFIQENMMYTILSSSDSEFSKEFKLDMVTMQNKIKECMEKIKEQSKRNKVCDDVHSKSECVNDITPDSIQSTSDIVHHDINEIEDMLDNEIHSYNKYTENNPMLGITWDGKNWRLRNIEYGIDSKSKNKDKMINKILEKIKGARNNVGFVRTDTIEYIKYKNKDIMVYGTYENPLFDIHHIIHLLEIDDERKYYNCRDKITHYGFKQNKYGGYIIKEFIQENAMYDIVLLSNSNFSKEFKKDVSAMLTELRKRGCMKITNDKLTLSNVPTSSNDPNINAQHVDFIESLIEQKTGMSYEDEKTSCYIKQLIREGSSIVLSKYSKKHVLYGMITTLVDQTGQNRVLIKFGYSENICERIQELRSDYKSKFYMVRIKIIHGESTEREFHKILKEKYPKYNVDTIIKGKIKDEIYVLDESLIIEYDNFEEGYINPNLKCIENVDDEPNNKNIIIRGSVDVVMSIEDPNTKLQAYDKHIDLLKHLSTMEYELKKMEYELKKMEYELKKEQEKTEQKREETKREEYIFKRAECDLVMKELELKHK